jgi:Tfp pilus assembly PilM family ATPase
MLFSRNQAQIGVEITDQQVRAVRILKSRRNLQLMDTAILPIQTTILAALNQLSQQLPYPGNKSIFAIDYDRVICKTVELASVLNERELATYFNSQAPTWFGLRGDEITLDYQPFNDLVTNRWQIVASKKIYVQEKIAQSHAAGFNLRAVDVNLLALPRIYHFVHGHADDLIAIIFVEPLYLRFCVINSQQLIYQARSPLPAADTPLYFHKLLTTIAHQTTAHPSLTCIYLAGHTLWLANCIEKIQAKIKIMVKLVELNPQRIQMQIPFDTRLLMSLALALWNFVA